VFSSTRRDAAGLLAGQRDQTDIARRGDPRSVADPRRRSM